ncbi:hypothetical protein HDV04_004887 [Boothiomyces sp. JEL0838]|nr:hypothetical protein HDV04_004887 [Boothiomyces sp. JEL0838]
MKENGKRFTFQIKVNGFNIREIQSLIQEKKLNRNRILELCEDIIRLDAGYAIHKRVDDTLWNACFYSRFEELKSDFKKSKSEITLLQLQGELDRANSFFKMLILDLTFDKDVKNVSNDPGLMIAYKSLIYLGDVDQSIEKQLLRHYQVLAFSLLLSITKECAIYVNSQLENGDTIEDLADTVIEHLLPISVLVTWLSSYVRTINSFISYGAMLRPKEFENKLHEWANAIVPIVNKVSSFADMDGGNEIISADALLISLSAFKDYYNSNSKILSSNTDSTITIFSRMSGFIKRLSEDEKFNFIIFNSQEGQYVVRDNSTKRKELQKMMKALATEKLKDEVKTLEIQHVLQSLDTLKNGEERINICARDAIRYLDQRLRYPSINLIGQNPEEQTPMNDIGNGTVFIPRAYLSILQCSHYFKSKSDERISGEFALVTDNPELTIIAEDLHIPVIQMESWKPKSRRT